jgi:hypothetical protein
MPALLRFRRGMDIVRGRASGNVVGAAAGGPGIWQGGWCRGRGRTSGKVGWWRAGGGIVPLTARGAVNRSRA